MTHDLRIERVLDARPELVFDTIVDPAYQEEIFTDAVEGWTVHRFEIDLRVGGTWTTEFGPRDGRGPNDVRTSVFTEVDRPRRLAYDVTMYIADMGRTFRYSETITLEEQDGKTLLTLVESGFATEADRDAFLNSIPDSVDAFQRVAERRAREGTG
jgi:uncharacterized protein YndB with AHSA1/START domain